MKQRVTRALYDYWDTLRGARPAPDRADIDPGAIRSCLPHTFVLTFDPVRGHPFRIAGTSLCEVFGAELSGMPFDRFWATDERLRISDLVRTVADDSEGFVADVTGRNADAETVDLEMIVLPLTSGDGGAVRILGALAIAQSPYWLGTRPLQSLHIGKVHSASATAASQQAPGQPLVQARGLMAHSPAGSRISRNYQG